MVFLAAAVPSYMLVLTLLAVATPGSGLSGSILDLVPSVWREQAHLPAYGLLAYLVMWGLRRSDWSISSAIVAGLGITCLFGLYTELLQHGVPGREASLSDWLADAAGAIVAGGLLFVQTWATRPAPCLVTARPSSLARSWKGLWFR